MGNTSANGALVDSFYQMICDAKPEFLDARNLKKLEKMRKDGKTPLC